MLTLNIEDLFQLNTNSEQHEALTQANTLVFDLNLSVYSDILNELRFPENSDEEEDEDVEENELFRRFFSPGIARLKKLLTSNTNLEHVELMFLGIDVGNEGIYHYSLDDFTLNLFDILKTLPTPISSLSLYIYENPFIKVLRSRYTYQNQIISNIKQTDAFKNIKHLKIMQQATDYTCNDDFSDFLENLFCAIPGKKGLKSLSFECDNCKFYLTEPLKNAFEECQQLTELSMQGRYINKKLWNVIGTFIQSHPKLKKISLDSRYATYSIAFMVNAMSNLQLLDATLNFTCFDENYINEIDLLGEQIKTLAGLSKLTMNIEFAVGSHSLWLEFLNSITANPTLSDFTIHLNDDYLQSKLPELFLKNKKLRLSDNSQNCNRIKDITQENSAHCNTYKPFFSLQPQQTNTTLSNAKLISMNSIWLSLMASYRLDPPQNKTLNDFYNQYFMLVIYQFFNQICCSQSQVLPEDVCNIIGEYTNMHTIVTISAVTGGYFFRQIKPYAIASTASANATEEESNKPDISG